MEFDAVHIDPSLPEENSPNRKPRTGMLTGIWRVIMTWQNSFVIGDRITDMELAKNLGARGIFFAPRHGQELLNEKGLAALG